MKTVTERTNASVQSRRQMVQTAACAIGGVFAVMAATPAQAKMTQKAAAYQATPKDNQNCANCALYKAPASCTLVEGDVAATGWCRFYKKK